VIYTCAGSNGAAAVSNLRTTVLGGGNCSSVEQCVLEPVVMAKRLQAGNDVVSGRTAFRAWHG
jgi:hypothetical protein